MRLALIEDSPTAITTELDFPLERVLRENASSATLQGVDIVSCSFTGPDHICRLPLGLGAPSTAESSDAAALESESGAAFLYPPDPDLVAALIKAAADPATYHRPDSLKVERRDAEADASADASGTTTLTIRAELERPEGKRWSKGLAAYYRVRWKGRDVAVVIPGRSYGGLGRLAAAAASSGVPFLGVARGGSFGSTYSDAPGRATLLALEKAGLRWSAVGGSEIEHWGELQDYRRENRPGGVSFLSANLVYSTDTARSVLPPYAVVEASGTRVALVGLTSDAVAPLLARAGLAGFTVADPMVALEALMPRLRSEADVVVALGLLPDQPAARLAAAARGLDLLLGEGPGASVYTPPPAASVSQKDRPAFAPPLPPLRVYRPAFNAYDVDRRPAGEAADWTVASSALLLDDSVNPAEGFPEVDLGFYFGGASTETPVIPPARAVFSAREHAPVYYARDFWTLSAGMLAERSRAEAGLLPVAPLYADALGAVRESLAREWLGPPEGAVVASVPGAKLKDLAAQAAEQRRREDADLPVDARLRFTVSGFDKDGLLRGAPLDADGVYRVATSRDAAAALDLPPPYELIPGTPTVNAGVLDELRAHGGASPADFRRWIEGRPVSEPGLWRVNFRDESLNLRETKVQDGDAFANVQNSRVQGNDEVLIGAVSKTDVEYLLRQYKWSNTLEMEYAKDRISPRGQPAATNVTANRIMFLTLGTKRLGAIPEAWLAHSWGPSVGLQYDGEFQASPGLPRKQVYSVFPGVEFFDGTVVKTLTGSGIIKRDLSRDPPNTQTGLRVRTLISMPIGPVPPPGGPGGIKLDAEFWNNYFFLTRSDNDSDLRVEGDANAKLSINVRKHLSVAPFVDLYWFGLKTRPVYGYSLMTGVSIGFSRVWKPQYEPF